MVSEDEPDFELLYYMSERDSCPEVADEAFRIFCGRHYSNLIESCRMTLSRLRYGTLSNGDELHTAAQELADAVIAEVADSLCKKFVRRPEAGTEGKAVRTWLARIAKNLARREMVARARAARMIPRNIGEADGDEVAENPNSHPSLVALIGSNDADELLRSSDDCSNSERRHLVRRAMNLLSDDDQKIINLSIEHGAGHSLDGHATRKNAKIWAALTGKSQAAIRQARKRALDRLKAHVAQLRTEDET